MNNTKELVYTSLFAALICAATFTIKVPLLVTNGYAHLGDGFIFISVILLGKKNGALAGGIGAALADLMGAFSHYALPTFIIKAVMCLIMGYVINDKPFDNFKWILGAVAGSLWQVAAYYAVGSVMVGSFISTLVEIPANILQSLFGIIVAVIFISLFKKTSFGKKVLGI